MTLFGIGGTLAMMIRTDLITSNSRFLGPQTYNAVVGLHGLSMILATIIMVTGPFGNFVVPIMIGARDMAFPRLNALSLWLLVAMLPIFVSAALLGGIPTGWSGYAPLSDQAPPGMDAYLMAIIMFAMSSAIAGANITTTILTMRARGMTWNRTPIFVWGVLASVGLAIPAFPMFMASMVLLGLDRTETANFYVASGGGSPWLYANLFWLMGHPEVYVIVLPAVVALMEIAPVFARKPIFSYTGAVLAIVGIVGLSMMVWAHHMYASGWAPDLNGPFMLTTEMISVPTGVLFLVVIGTLWRGRIWTTLPMMSVYAMLWNFIIGGVTGIYLSDVPADYDLHGSMFVTAHFHYTLMGAGLTGAIGALAFWFPKMTGRMLNDRAGKVSFWFVQIGFNVTFIGMFAVGLAGPAATRRALRQHVRGRQPGVEPGRLHDRHRHARAVVGRGELVAPRRGRAGQPVGQQDPRVDGAEPGAAGELQGAAGGHRRPVRVRRGRSVQRAHRAGTAGGDGCRGAAAR